ncbi:MAG: acyl-CoA thioesterase [Gemmatimonadota bacterium]
MPADYKRPTDSDTTITELMIPAYANFGGKIHGGQLLSLMDKVAYACAAKHAGTYCVTVAVEGVHFLAPVEVGDLVSLQARVNYTGRTSMVVGIRVTAENVRNGIIQHTNTSYFTMVAKDDDGALTRVPGLLLTDAEDVRRYTEAIRRRELKDAFEASMSEQKQSFDVASGIEALTQYNCRVEMTDGD